MIDLGVTTGIKELWQENLLRDFTLVVEGREFQVHKVVLAAVSHYFKAMLGEGYMESKMDKVEVKGFPADIVGKLLKFIYMADENIIAGDTLGVLQCAIYLQMPSIVNICVKKLMENLNVQNCLEALSAVIEYSFCEELKELRDFIQRNCVKVIESFDPKVISYEALQVLVGLSESLEWEKFICIRSWVCNDYENHISFLNDLMVRIHFCIMSPKELKSVLQMDIYCKTEGPWHDLVGNAVKYHQLPTHLKVLDRSEQSKVKTEPVFAVFSANRPTHKPKDFTVNMFAQSEGKKWVKQEHKGFNSSILDEIPATVCVEVNNFLIVCRTYKINQDWQMFDPRTSTWSSMPNMEKPKRYFAMVHHKDILYTVGGKCLPDDTPSREMDTANRKYIPGISSCEIDQYSLLTNDWSCVHKLPDPLLKPAACVLGDTIYVSGGWNYMDYDPDGSENLYCLDLSADTLGWGKRAPCLWKLGCHKMCVLKRNGEEGLFLIDRDLAMQFYGPSNDQWSEITNIFKPDVNCTGLTGGLVVAKGNSVFILNMELIIFDHEAQLVCSCSDISWKLTIPEVGEEITRLDLEEIPQLPRQSDLFGSMLAIPPQKSKTTTDIRHYFLGRGHP